MWATSDGPRMEDFGITEEDLERAPRLFLSNHRPAVLVGAYLVAAAAVFTLILHSSQSMPAAVFFTVVGLAAGSVLLLPALVLLVCAGERAEEKWLCRRVPMLRACLAYQRAVADHRCVIDDRASNVCDVGQWSAASGTTFSTMVRAELEQRFRRPVFAVDREEAGFDYRVDLQGRRLIFRCQAGPEPVAAAVGRELVAAIDDFQAQAAVIVTPAQPTDALRQYIVNRPITVVAPWALERVDIPEA